MSAALGRFEGSAASPGTSVGASRLRANALFHVAERRVELREVELPPPGEAEILIRSRCSAISAGTEAMIFGGAFPKDASLDATIESLKGGFDYPFRYGYALVGEVEDIGPGVDEALLGRLVFAFHPHQDRAVVPLADCVPIPDGIPAEAALFLPQVETAVNFVMDGAPLIGERVLVFGLGVVGLLTAALLQRFPLARLIAAEPLAWRRDLARQWNIDETLDPSDAGDWHGLLSDLEGADLIFELSGDMRALGQAIDAAGFDARIVVGSWYGARSQPLELGGRCHRNRLRLVSSQVSTLHPSLTGRWDKRRRIESAWRMLRELQPERLISRSFSPDRCAEAFETVCARREGVMQVIFRY
ncbi:MAG TPA: zinc-binding alcohol dehydrogenase [Burkholderiaceae bacterium]|nr:zinc-binding alcohol dehydrogenase [Burkholderiaceae bacterium]